MKKIFKLSLVLFVVVAMSSCGGGGTPEQVAEEFLNALNKQDYSKAKKLGTEATVKTIEMIESLSKMGGDEMKGDKADTKEFTDFKSEINGDAAVVSYKENGSDKKIDLVKQGKEWKVDMKKEGMGGAGDSGSSSTETQTEDNTENENAE